MLFLRCCAVQKYYFENPGQYTISKKPLCLGVSLRRPFYKTAFCASGRFKIVLLYGPCNDMLFCAAQRSLNMPTSGTKIHWLPEYYFFIKQARPYILYRATGNFYMYIYCTGPRWTFWGVYRSPVQIIFLSDASTILHRRPVSYLHCMTFSWWGGGGEEEGFISDQTCYTCCDDSGCGAGGSHVAMLRSVTHARARTHTHTHTHTHTNLKVLKSRILPLLALNESRAVKLIPVARFIKSRCAPCHLNG